MSFKVNCPHCGREGKLPRPVAAGTPVKCPGCRNRFEVPENGDAAVVPQAAGVVAAAPAMIGDVSDAVTDLDLSHASVPGIAASDQQNGVVDADIPFADVAISPSDSAITPAPVPASPAASPTRQGGATRGSASSVPADKPRQGLTSAQGYIIITLLLIGLGVPFFGAFRPTPKWEYKIETPSDVSFDREMNQLGADGWELVSARRATSSYGGDPKYEMIFKRQTW